MSTNDHGVVSNRGTELGDLVDAELGPIPQSLLREQAARWNETAKLGPSGTRHATRLPLFIGAAALVAATVLVVIASLPSVAPTVGPPVAASSSGVLASSRTYPFDVAASDTLRHIELAPDEELTLSPGARGEVERSSPSSTVITLREGALSLSVPEGTGRRWAVLAGPYRIEVVGTKFSVTWLPTTAKLAVAVERGQVRVAGGDLREARLLSSGERLERGAPPPTASAKSSAASTPNVAPSVPRPAPPSEPTWRELHQKRLYREALAAAEREGYDRLCSSLGASELVTLAGMARLARNPDRARQALETVRQRFPGTSEAATAAFLLGRQGSSSAHTQWLETYLTEQPNGPYAQEAQGRLLVSYQNRGEQARARAKAQSYLERYPNGAYAEHARSILGQKPAPTGNR